MSDERIPVPRTLDALPRFLFWEVDYVLVAAVGFCIGAIVAGTAFGFVTSIAMTYGWSRARSGAGVGRAFAFLYWHLPSDVFERVPASARRHFLG